MIKILVTGENSVTKTLSTGKDDWISQLGNVRGGWSVCFSGLTIGKAALIQQQSSPEEHARWNTEKFSASETALKPMHYFTSQPHVYFMSYIHYICTWMHLKKRKWVHAFICIGKLGFYTTLFHWVSLLISEGDTADSFAPMSHPDQPWGKKTIRSPSLHSIDNATITHTLLKSPSFVPFYLAAL